jgi:elongation factor 2
MQGCSHSNLLVKHEHLTTLKKSRKGETLTQKFADAPITIKSANISLPYELLGDHYLVNLVDTPGHVDFSGKVTRAMRAIDGAIIVVDAVEEVMAQTESVLRAAIQEQVKPVLFINKIDRLIRELKLPPKDIQKKLTRIIERINTIIYESIDSTLYDLWKVSNQSGTVVFGSALHKWGFTTTQMRKLNLRFQDIIKYYAEDQIVELSTLLPISKSIQKMIICTLPSPQEAQKYRIRRIWSGELTSQAGIALINCDKQGPLLICITKVVEDPRFDSIAVGRVFSGTIRKGATVSVLPGETQFNVQRIILFMGSRRVVVPSVAAGNICGLVGLRNIKSGSTITGIEVPRGMVSFEEIKYFHEPVVTISIEPRHPRELPKLLSTLEILTQLDPNLIFQINKDTGENLLSGIGLLHLEITLQDIEKMGIEVIASEPIVMYRETPKKPSTLEEPIFSPNTENSIKISLNSLADSESKNITSNQDIWLKDKRNNSLAFMALDKIVSQTARDSLESGFIWACERGPLCGEPIGSTVVRILDIDLNSQPQNRSKVELMSMIKDAVFKAFSDAEMTLLEPLYEIEVLIPKELVREITGIILARRGKTGLIEYKGTLVTIKGMIPVSETFDLASAIRSRTSGRAIWQTRFASWQKVPESRIGKIVSTIRKRKGWRGS